MVRSAFVVGDALRESEGKKGGGDGLKQRLFPFGLVGEVFGQDEGEGPCVHDWHCS